MIHYHAFDPKTPCWAYTCPQCELRDHRRIPLGVQGGGPDTCLRCDFDLRRVAA
jgi:hypothetical protein